MNPNRPWKVCYPERVRRKVAALVRRAVAVGLHQEVVQAVKSIDRMLHSRPESFGEEAYRLPALQLRARVGCQQPLFVRYTVHETLPLVFVVAIGPLYRSGLD
jgi:hypothetical protein